MVTLALELVAEGLGFPEGPIAAPDRSTLVTEMEGKPVSQVSPKGGVMPIAETDGGPNGPAVGPDGALDVTDNGGLRFGFRC